MPPKRPTWRDGVSCKIGGPGADLLARLLDHGMVVLSIKLKPMTAAMAARRARERGVTLTH